MKEHVAMPLISIYDDFVYTYFFFFIVKRRKVTNKERERESVRVAVTINTIVEPDFTSLSF